MTYRLATPKGIERKMLSISTYIRITTFMLPPILLGCFKSFVRFHESILHYNISVNTYSIQLK